MRIKSWGMMTMGFLLVAVLSAGSFRLMAATIETEDDDDNAPPPTPSKSDASTGGSGKLELEQALTRARIDDLIGFFYFVKSGYVVPDPSRVPSLGKIIGSFGGQMNYSTPKQLYVQLPSSKEAAVKAGDFLVVYRAGAPILEKHSGFSGYWVENLALVKVIEVQKKECLVEVKKSFSPFEEGDRVKSYDDEIKRWKQAQTKKELPIHPIRCFVAAGTKPMTQNYWNQNDFVILTAGTKKGVVEGQTFRLNRIVDRGPQGEPLHSKEGLARIFYAGPESSMAEIISNQGPIEKGFEALYEP
jgi:hypothetical protein